MIKNTFIIMIVLSAIAIPAYSGYAPGNAPFINTWLVLGTFDNADNLAFNTDIIEETSILPHEEIKSAGQTWQYFDDRLFSRNYDDYQDLYSYFHIKQQKSVNAVAAYLHVYIWSPNDYDAQIRLGVHTECKIWINGQSVGSILGIRCVKDSWGSGINLNRGWNRLLIKAANTSETCFGAYARICDKDGNAIPGLVYSANGPVDKLAVSTRKLDAFDTGNMPVAYHQWPYVSFNIPYIDIAERRIPNLIGMRHMWAQASDFMLTAEGSSAPYMWKIIKGNLPKGLELKSDGRIIGRVSKYAEEGTHDFTVRVTDSDGNSADKSLSITVKENPVKWYEEGRIGGLIHAPEYIPKDEYAEFANLLKRQGYCLAMPICYGNAADDMFKWSSRFRPDSPQKDIFPEFKKSVEAEGIRAGMYIGWINNSSYYTFDQIILMLEDAIVKCRPAALWLDWAGDVQVHPETDAWFSMIKSMDPDIILIMNAVAGQAGGLLNGDWDVCNTEDMSYSKYDLMWNYWPGEAGTKYYPMINHWPKVNALESWRPMFDVFPGISEPDWKEFLKIQISLICEGHIANMDHSYTVGFAPPGETLTIAKSMKDNLLISKHAAMADWANPVDIPSLLPSYTNVNPGPLNKTSWGYDTISRDRKTIYLHIMKNPRGKKGLPIYDILSVDPINIPVETVTWMNKNQKLDWNTDVSVLNIDISDVEQDDIDTIIKIELAYPYPENTPDRLYEAPAYKWPKPKPGNLAAYKSAKLLSLDCTHELVPSGGINTAFSGIDSDMETCAQGAYEWPWTYHVDLEESLEISRIAIYFGGYFATEYAIKISENGNDWKEIAHVTNGDGKAREFKFKPEKARYIRVFGIKPDDGKQAGLQMSISELEVSKK